MSLSNPKTIYGIHQVTMYSRTDGTPYGTVQVLKSSSLSLQGSLVKLTAGSNRYPWAIEDSLITAELSLKFSEYPAFLFTLFMGKTPTTTVSDAAGTIVNFVNNSGTSIKNASNGITGISVIPSTGAANLKFGKYVLKAVGSSTVDLYMSTSLNHGRGTAVDFIDDSMKVNAAPITITVGNIDQAAYGLRIVGLGTPAFVVGDTATFDVRPPHTGQMEVQVGNINDVYPEFGALVYAQKRSDNTLTCVDLYRCKCIGLPIGFDTHAFSEAQVKAEALYDSAQGGILNFINIKTT